MLDVLTTTTATAADPPAPVAPGTRLQRLLQDACRHVPLYRQLWASAGFDVQSLQAGVDFARLPLLDKTRLRACPAEHRIHERRRHVRLAEELSSGSSGEPLVVFKDAAGETRRRLAFLRALVACGYRPGQRCLLLTSRRAARRSTLARWHYASIAEDTGALAARLDDLQPQVLYGPLSTLELLAEHRLQHAPGRPIAGVVISTAEQLTPQRRTTLERGFGAPIADFYGMSELGLVAYRRPGDAQFTPARPSLMLEFLPLAGEPAIERLVVTDLAERTAPWIRYDTGDLVRRDWQLPGQPLLEFAGRSMDCIALPDGRHISPYRVDVLLEQVPGLRAYEVVQQADHSLDVTIELAPATGAHGVADVLRGLETLLGTTLALRLRTGLVERGQAGAKFRPIRSLVRRPA